jgi:hypothetical protein
VKRRASGHGAAAAIDLLLLTVLRQLLRRKGKGLRLAGGPLHQGLLRAALEGPPPWLAFHSAAVWGELVAAGRVDAALVSVAGVVGDAGLRPPLRREGLALVPLGQRPLRLLFHRCHRQRPQGWLLPPVWEQPLLHRQLQTMAAAVPRRCCKAVTAAGWLKQLAAEPLVLPVAGPLLQQPGWRGAPLCWWPPAVALQERVWVVVQQQDLDRQEVQLLLQWWGGPRLELP